MVELLLWFKEAGGGSVTINGNGRFDGSVRHRYAGLSYRIVRWRSVLFLIVVMPNPGSKVGRFDFGFFGVLVEVNMSSCGTMKIPYRVTCPSTERLPHSKRKTLAVLSERYTIVRRQQAPSHRNINLRTAFVR